MVELGVMAKRDRQHLFEDELGSHICAEQKSFERFVRLPTLKFDGTIREMDYEFLTECQDRLFNMFTEAFLERFVTNNLRNQCRDELDRLDKGSLSISEYEAHFHDLTHFAMLSIPTEFERVCKLVKGFACYLQEATSSLVLSGGTFQSIIDHARMIENFRHARQGSSAKTFCRQGQLSGHLSISRDYSGQFSQGYKDHRSNLNPSYNWEGCVSHHGNYDTISPDERNIWSLAHEDPYEHLRNLEVDRDSGWKDWLAGPWGDREVEKYRYVPPHDHPRPRELSGSEGGHTEDMFARIYNKVEGFDKVLKVVSILILFISASSPELADPIGRYTFLLVMARTKGNNVVYSDTESDRVLSASSSQKKQKGISINEPSKASNDQKTNPWTLTSKGKKERKHIAKKQGKKERKLCVLSQL
ncbi:hypothetical protein MTR67_044362 [Solanum verrucosum]|uniref:Retrotransposon gag domain-containing protein n=1 Tax=Solanum verrucosum TaxID=315347 RepID=A0AAF0UR48_SOLVR|nr:hypothetical protein MTR67_044362 [Solanum verrucosum]